MLIIPTDIEMFNKIYGKMVRRESVFNKKLILPATH